MSHEDGTIISLSLTGGFAVLVSYCFIGMTGVGSKLYGVFTNNEKTVFKTLSLLSIISFFYLFYWASFYEDWENEENWPRDLYIGSVATYLVGACLWSLTSYSIIKNKLHPSVEVPALLITAIGTIGVLISVASVEGNGDGDLGYSLAMIAAILFVFQHAIFDLIYWSYIHASRRSYHLDTRRSTVSRRR